MANFTPAQFDEMDTDHDGRVTLEELVAYGMKHPKKDAPANASSTQTPTTAPANSNNSAAERLMPTYEGNTLEHWLNVFRRTLIRRHV